MALSASDLARRSFLYRELAALGAAFEELNGYAAAMTCGAEADAEVAQARSLGLSDLSALKRAGYKGWSTADWLRERGAELGDDSNRAYPQADGTRIARLAPGEALLLGDLAGESPLIDRLADSWSMASAAGCYQVPREDVSCWLKISGEHAAAMFAKVCAVDLRPQSFDAQQIAQTNVARLNAILIRDDLGPVLAYDLLTDIASAVYLWRSLLDAMAEFDGKPVGLAALRDLAGAAV